MKTSIRKSLIATGLIAALGGLGMGQAMAFEGAGMTTHNENMSQATHDTWITTKVKSEFATTKGVPATDISVTTKHGVVILSGTVKSDAQKQTAEMVAKKVKGVKSVEDSGLKVVGS
ncbi:BON domain-containing protein [Oleiagrimonas sp. C23AA]|uniref:BON domain-containing protein n=1 Tax=Oleiagrimonas sp. C23AA TaxID=2719047 RepID=UPI0014209ECE|nr:BON domain-containing protein [Oleiagrimonas sp. C23AA]NII10788.1 BON domain-containing protein [Oleiagrimonas sp. C23AA]